MAEPRADRGHSLAQIGWRPLTAPDRVGTAIRRKRTAAETSRSGTYRQPIMRSRFRFLFKLQQVYGRRSPNVEECVCVEDYGASKTIKPPLGACNRMRRQRHLRFGLLDAIREAISQRLSARPVWQAIRSGHADVAFPRARIVAGHAPENTDPRRERRGTRSPGQRGTEARPARGT